MIGPQVSELIKMAIKLNSVFQCSVSAVLSGWIPTYSLMCDIAYKKHIPLEGTEHKAYLCVQNMHLTYNSMSSQ